MHGLRIAEPLLLPFRRQHQIALLGNHGVNRCHDGGVGAEVAVVPNDYFCVILYGQVEIAEEAPADFGMSAIVEGNGPLDESALSELPDDFLQNRRPLFRLVLMGAVVVHIQVMCLPFDCP